MFDFLRTMEFLTGLFYFIFGLDGFLKKLPMPIPSGPAIEFLIAIDKARFILPTVKFIEIVAGLFFILGYQCPLAWCLMSPLVFNILAYHFLLNKKEKWMPLGILSLHSILFVKYFSVLQALLI